MNSGPFKYLVPTRVHYYVLLGEYDHSLELHVQCSSESVGWILAGPAVQVEERRSSKVLVLDLQ